MSRFGRTSLNRATQAKTGGIYFAISNDRIAQINSRHQMPGWIELNDASHIGGKEPLFSFSEVADGKLCAKEGHREGTDQVTNSGKTYESRADFSKRTKLPKALSDLSAKLPLSHTTHGPEADVDVVPREEIAFRLQADVVCEIVGKSGSSARFGISSTNAGKADTETDDAVLIYRKRAELSTNLKPRYALFRFGGIVAVLPLRFFK